MKLIDRYDPKLSEANQRLSAKNLISTYTTERKIPYIEMRLLGDQVIATVTFDFWYDKKRTKKFAEFDKINRTIEGPSDEVYKLAAKQASKISLSLSSIFNDECCEIILLFLTKTQPTFSRSHGDLEEVIKVSCLKYSVQDGLSIIISKEIRFVILN